MMAGVDRKQRVNAVLERTIGYQLSRPLADRAWRIPPPKLLNSVLVRVTGYQLSRPLAGRTWKLPAAGGGRLLTSPVFIFSAPRSGSTLLRAILGSHTELYAPPELPLKHLGVRADTKWIEASLEGLELTIEDLEHMLWDRVLADAQQRSGKPRIVVKTPSNVLVWERIAACWPDAKHIFLLRHPAAAVASLHSSFDPAWRPDGSRETGGFCGPGASVHDGGRGGARGAAGIHRPVRGADRLAGNAWCGRCAVSSACRSSRACSTTGASAMPGSRPGSATAR